MEVEAQGVSRSVAHRTRDDGQATVELALVLPVLLLIVVGLLQFGRGFYYWITMNHVANEAARWAAVDRVPTNAAPQNEDIQRYVCSEASTREMQKDMKVTVDFRKGASTTFDTSSSGLAVGDAIRVRVTKNFNIGFWSGLPGSLTIRGTSVMRVERLGGPNGASLTSYDGAPEFTCS